MAPRKANRSFGIVGGLGPLAGADIFFKLVKATPARSDKEHFEVVFEQRPFDNGNAVVDEHFNPSARKLHVFNVIKGLEQRGVSAVILTCFISHSFIDELQPEIDLPIVNLMEALRAHIDREFSDVQRMGVLTSSYLIKERLFERYFDDAYDLIYPTSAVQRDCLMEAIYGPQGIKAGHLRGRPIELIGRACQDLIEQGAEVIVPGLTEIPIVIDSLSSEQAVTIVDSNQVYAEYAVRYQGKVGPKSYKIGIVGGVGPSATVDLMNKIIALTPAKRDQDHIRLIVEHNPEIPDRTENLVSEGADPTISLYSACKKLEANDADLIAIPCNTAHAYVERIQRHLMIPIVNMVFEAIEYSKRHYPDCRTIGLLATTGTVKSRIYHELMQGTGLHLIEPDNDFQEKVMDAIYGDEGVKAGFVEGECREALLAALAHLVEKGAEIVILGCTELPLILPQVEDFPVAGRSIVILDPTEILARKCVELRGQMGFSTTVLDQVF